MTQRTNKNLTAIFRVDGEANLFTTQIRADSVASFGKALERACENFDTGFFPLAEGSKAKRPFKRTEPRWNADRTEVEGWELPDGRLMTVEMFVKVGGGLVPA